MNKPIRCTTQKPSPYLEKHMDRMIMAARPDLPHSAWTTPEKYRRDILRESGIKVVDVGGGNGRNLALLQDMGIRHCVLLDKAGDFGVKYDMEERTMPIADGFADIVLVNYVLMLLSDMFAVEDAVRDIKRITKPGGCVMIEVQWLPNEQCLVHTPKSAEKFVKDLAELFEWPMLHKSKYRFIAQKPG